MSPWLQCANISQHEFKIAIGFLITMFYKCGKSILFNKFAETLQGVIIYNMSMIYIHITIITGICNNVIWICAEGMERGWGVSSKKESDSTKLKVKSCYLKLMMMWKTNSRYPRIEELLTLSKVNWTLSDNTVIYIIGYSNNPLSNNVSPWVYVGIGGGG